MRIFFFILLFLFIGSVDPALSAENRIVEIARSQLGKGEIGGNNKGSQVKAYTLGQEVSWCAGFVSWVLKEAGVSRQKYLLSARRYWVDYKANRVKTPRAGDIICFYRGIRGDWIGHVGIVEKVQGQTLVTIEGNVGRYPARVKEIRYRIGHIPHLLGFVRI